MYLRHLHVQNVKLLRSFELPFTRLDGTPRMWTVIIGENGLCKTTLLQAIALAALGKDRANQLGDIPSLRDQRRPRSEASISARFGFGELGHRLGRRYPGLTSTQRPLHPPSLRSRLEIGPLWKVFQGGSRYDDTGGAPTNPDDPMAEARGMSLGHWFCAGYGVNRALPLPVVTQHDVTDVIRARVASLFAPVQIIGTGFADLLGEEQARAYAKSLKRVLLGQTALLPNVRDVELGGRKGVTKAEDLVKKHRFSYSVGSKAHKLPATWLSHGYQSTIAWVADLVGHVMWEADKRPVPAEEMEGLVLVDELDLHLHPRWQVGLVQALKRTFPRLQFIVTTHSPMLLPGLEADEVVRLAQDEEGNVVWRAPGRSPKLMTGSDLYETFFDLPGVYPEELAAALRTYTNLAADPDRDDEEEAALRHAQALLRDAGIDLEWEPRPRRVGDDAHDSH
jgi:hypothetical protein